MTHKERLAINADNPARLPLQFSVLVGPRPRADAAASKASEAGCSPGRHGLGCAVFDSDVWPRFE